LREDEKVKKQMADFSTVGNTYKESYASTRLDHTYNSKLEENERQIKDAMSVGIKKFMERVRGERKANGGENGRERDGGETVEKEEQGKEEKEVKEKEEKEKEKEEEECRRSDEKERTVE
jgi:hypothetical protein